MEEDDVAQNLGLEIGIYSFQILTEMLFILYSIHLGKIRKSISVRPVQFPCTSFLIFSSLNILRPIIRLYSCVSGSIMK
jgi:hypothetical protein